MTTTYFHEGVPPLRAEDMIHDLLRLPNVLAQLIRHGAEWQPLAEALLRVNTEEKAPTGKQLQLQMGLTPSKYRRWLDALYAAYLHLLETDPNAVPFQQVEYLLVLKGKRASQEFSCRLPVTPRVGEQLQLDFLLAVTGESMFYVDSLTHDFSEGRYLILVYLKAGYYNAYLHQLRQRASFDQIMSLHAEFGTPDFLLESFLRERYPPPSESAAAYELLERAEERYGRNSHFGRRKGKRKRT